MNLEELTPAQVGELEEISDNNVTEVMKIAGESISALLYDATVDTTLGIEVDYDDVSEHDEKLVKAYLAEEIGSVETIYLAMEHARQQDNKRFGV